MSRDEGFSAHGITTPVSTQARRTRFDHLATAVLAAKGADVGNPTQRSFADHAAHRLASTTGRRLPVISKTISQTARRCAASSGGYIFTRRCGTMA